MSVVTKVIRKAVRRFQVTNIRSGPASGMRIGMRHSSSDYADGEMERPVQEAIAAALHEGDVFYDIGANVGFFTLVASRRVGATGELHAFEPRPSNVRALQSNLKRNGLGHARVWPVAVGSDDGTVTLWCPPHPGGATIERSEADAMTREEQVPIVTIDRLVGQGEIAPPDVVKIDVEGAEMAVIDGMMSTITEHHPVIVYEVDDPTADGMQRKHARLRERLQSLDYTVEELAGSYDDAEWHVLHAIGRPATGSNSPA